MALGLAPEHPPPVQTPGPPPVPVAMQTPASMKERTLSDILDEEPDYESLPTNKLSAHLLAGGVAGMMEHCFMYPVDCIKTRMMMLDPPTSYRNVAHALYRIVTQERPKVLFRGIGVVATGAGPAHAMYFSCYEFTKKRLSEYCGGNNVLAQGGAGALSSFVHDGLMNPVEMVKQRLQVYQTPYRNAVHCIRSVYKTEGMKAFYRSFTTQLTMNVPFQVLHFVGYEYLQDLLNQSRSYNPLSHMVSGALAGGVAAACTTPLDVARTYLNTHEQRRGLRGEQQVRGMLRALRKIYQISGARGYFRGISPRVIFQMPSTAISWSVYELFKYILGLKEAERQEVHQPTCDADSLARHTPPR